MTGSPTEPKRLRHGYTNATTVEGRGNGKAADEERQCPDFPATPLRRVGSDGSALLHGDFGPQNMLFDEGTLQMAALVDWEFIRRRPVEDLAWTRRLRRVFGSSPPVGWGGSGRIHL